MHFGGLPPEVNSGLMYTGAGAGPLLAAASAWDGVAAELHAAAAGYNSVIAGLTTEGWLGPASRAMAAAAAPYAAWMSGTAAQVEQTAAQARAAVAAYEAAFAATVPPAVIATNRANLALLVATNVLGQNTPAIAANEAAYAEMWAQDATAMDGYDATASPTRALAAFSRPRQVADPGGLLGQAGAVTRAGGESASTGAQQIASSAAAMPVTPTGTDGLSEVVGMSSVKDGVSWATFVPQNGSYLAGLANAGVGLVRAMAPAATAASATTVSANAAGALGSSLGGLGGLGGFGSAVTAGLGQSGTIGALSVPQAWAAASPLAGSAGSAVSGATLAGAVSAAPGPGVSPGLLNGMPLLANAAARGADGQNFALPRFDLRPSVIPSSPAAG